MALSLDAQRTLPSAIKTQALSVHCGPMTPLESTLPQNLQSPALWMHTLSLVDPQSLTLSLVLVQLIVVALDSCFHVAGKFQKLSIREYL